MARGARAPSNHSDVEKFSDVEDSDAGSFRNPRNEVDHAEERRKSIHSLKESISSGVIPQYDMAEEVERLRAMNAQLQLSQHRQRLAKQLEDKEGRANNAPASTSAKTRISPIHEESISPSLEAAFISPMPSSLETASTESARTIRGGETPAALSARTPSYPFPPMRTPRQLSYSGHRPFTALSPTVNPSNFAGGFFHDGPHDHVVSGPITPASTLNFQPAGSQHSRDDPNFETPNLYDLSLMLSAEPGLDPWWSTVVQIMRDVYKADRVTLSVPADSTDVENVPWGQKATFNAAEEDDLSLAYLQQGSGRFPSSGDTNETSNSEGTAAGDSPPIPAQPRPGLTTRHSFTSYEVTTKEPTSFSEASRNTVTRPPTLTRAKSYAVTRPDPPPRTATLKNAQLSLQALQEHMAQEEAKPASWEDVETSSRDVRGRVFPVLQALDFEADPLIDNSGILRVLERGKVIALTRDYPYLSDPVTEDKSTASKVAIRSLKKDSPERSKKTRPPELTSRSSMFGNKHAKRPSRSIRGHTGEKWKLATQLEDELPLPFPKYEEYEQAPPSPWSQSPAPSPAVRAETTENPFFADPTIDEETFNPNQAPEDYSKMQPVEAIGIDRSWTVLHIPLAHPLLSKPVQSFRLDAAVMESKSAGRARGVPQLPKYPDPSKPQAIEQAKEKQTPIAILSILSSVIPYPSNLRHSLENLSPHMATSFSLCRHYSNLETEVAGLSRKRPHTTGFGAIAPAGRPGHEQPTTMSGNISYSPSEEGFTHQSTGGSITSPSDYSGVSRSANASPSGTPGWDPGSVGLTMDRKSAGGSPGYITTEGYFGSRTRPGISRMDTGSGSSITGVRRSSKENSPAETRPPAARSSAEDRSSAVEPSSAGSTEDPAKIKTDVEGSQSTTTVAKQENRAHRSSKEPAESSEPREPSPSHHNPHESPRRQAMRGASHGAAKSERQHTLLHSYGADFGATFQSLPTTSAPSIKAPAAPKAQSRQGSMAVPTDMPPPSDRLKGLMLDSLPAHVFVALPQTGEIVWVNSRYLTYRGQTVSELYQDPWGSIHPDEREDYLKAWTHAVKTGEQFSMQVRIRRFDGSYRWFYTRAVGSRDIRGVIVQWYGSHMDIHDQHIAEVKAARQEEIEASEAKHRQLANLIPQIIFAATEDEGVTFANEQWLSYTGQDFNDALGLGFMDYVHPDDLARCQIPIDRPPTPLPHKSKKPGEPIRNPSQTSSGGKSGQSGQSSNVSEVPTETTVKGIHQSLSRNNSSSSSSVYEFATADLSELARSGVIKITTDSNGRLSYTTEVRLRSKTGEYRWHLVRCVEVDNINLGSGDGSWFGACTDINDHKLLETKLKEAMESKGKFLSNMSHEIRTPLIGISGMDTVLNDEQLDYTNTIQSSASSLLNIINDILDLSKVDAGMMKLSYEWFHTRSLVEEVNEMVSTMAITKRLELNYVVEVDVPEMVKGDKFRIRQVLLNVIGNAIKFTTVGEVFSRCRVYNEPDSTAGENEVMLEYSIVDTGRGFTKEEAELIFKPFSQIDGSSTRQHGGSGLGLVISRQLVELHGGKMQGTAIPGKGSTFTFTAKFGLPTSEDHPEPLATPALTRVSSDKPAATTEISTMPKHVTNNPILASRLLHSPAIAESPKTESSIDSPAVTSSDSSEPSLRSMRSHLTERSSGSSIAQSLHHFSEAARASNPDLSQMKLELPEKHAALSPTAITSPTNLTLSTPTPTLSTPNPTSLPRKNNSPPNSSIADLKNFRPPMYSILLICPQTHSREATTQHIEITLPKDVPHQITPLASVEEARRLISGEDPVIFTHIVLNLGSAEEIVQLIDQIVMSVMLPQISIVVLSDPVQRQEVIKMATAYDYDQLAKDNRVTFIYKPVKPSRFAVIFDPDKERDLSTDRNRSSAQQQVASQKQHYLDVGQRLGNKGLKVLLVEDNQVNQKVLLKFLSKVGIAVELALDGMECTERVFAKPHGTYSLILCDLHMPRKDGYQTCREIREWEEKGSYPKMPIIALSANVMADVLDKCIQAGFNSYVTKPVDFKLLSKAMSNLLDPGSSANPEDFPGTLMKPPS
ncbi:hsp90 protein [Rutstroemia sp. NJR-2017a BVV2]|nr:hsp90 protein [Rutstroemia sp. NJR-2017a BVV2]